MNFSEPIRLDGKAAIVTGASRGIGLAIAESYLQAGASVCLTARKKDELEAAAAELNTRRDEWESPGRVTFFAGSTGDPDAVMACVDYAMQELGRVDLLVNNAATNPAFGPLIDVELGAWRKTLAVNVEGPLQLIQACWRSWMKENGGSVLNVTTSGMYGVAPFLGAYEATKTTLRFFTKQLAGELAPKVRVNSISPGLIKTQMARVLWESGEEAVSAATPMGRIGMPEDCAHAALFLASERASWVTGMDFLIDGGALVGAASIAPAASGDEGAVAKNLFGAATQESTV